MNGKATGSGKVAMHQTLLSDLDSDAHDWHDDSDLDQDDSYYVPDIRFTEKLTSLDPSLYQGSGDDFSTEENYEQTSAYINHQLSIYGFSSNLQFLSADKASASKIVTTLYKILQHHLKDTEYKEEMDLNWRRLSSDYDMTLQNLNATKALLEKSERESDMLGGRVAALEEELRVETEKHRYTREELKSSRANLQYTKTQYAHEARKKEQEMNVLKDKVQKLINRSIASSSSIPGGIKILNPVARSLYGTQHTNEAEQLLKEVIEQQQAKEAEVVEENEQLRRTLYTVHVELERLMNKNSTQKNTSPTPPYGLPFDMIRDRIETDIRDTLTLLSDQWNHRPSLNPTISATEVVVRDQRIDGLQKEMEKMRLELEDSTLLVQGAQRMIDNLSGGNFLSGVQDFKLNVEGSEMTLEELEEAETRISKQREDLARERKTFTEACLDLGKQREELDQAWKDFEESKRTFRLDKVMSFLSFSPSSEKRTLDVTPPSSPSRRNGSPSKKRMASSPLPFSVLTRSVRPKMQTTVLEVPDEDSDDRLWTREAGRQASWHSGELGHIAAGRGGGDSEENDVSEDEETLRRRPTRQRTNLLPSFGSGEQSRDNYEAARQRLSTSDDTLPSSFSFSTSTAPTTTRALKPALQQATTATQKSATVTDAARSRSTPMFKFDQKKAPSPIPMFATSSRGYDTTNRSDKTTTNRAGTGTSAGMDGMRSSSNSSNDGDSAPRSTTPVPLMAAAKVPSALSKAAANLAARKSTSRYPASSNTNTNTTTNISPNAGARNVSAARQGSNNGSTATRSVAVASSKALSSLLSGTATTARTTNSRPSTPATRLGQTPAPTTTVHRKSGATGTSESSAGSSSRQKPAPTMSASSSTIRRKLGANT
ncbi:hypothetical protein BGZ99_000424 [Dissophora globulifera]|uniref:Uncharacterized protein n=1 Tax=Dissophora globulifera TaxID=979702 RepID=A0A9P6UYH7_9FUNG|nr:hypothetical protein BGZ99_000424 [Dissophora globulifera]